jgi:hypothetical protein
MKCTPDVMNNRLKNDQNMVERIEEWVMKARVNSNLFFIFTAGITKLGANEIRPYNNDETLEEYYKREYGVTLKYPNMVCIWEWEQCTPDDDKYYPLELVYIYPDFCK